MELPKRAAKLEWNFNSILNLITLVGMISGGGWIWANTTRDIEDLQVNTARNEERFRNIENEVRKIDNLTYRVAQTEQSTSTTATAIKELQSVLSQQSGDLKVVREILQRIEAAQRGDR